MAGHSFPFGARSGKDKDKDSSAADSSSWKTSRRPVGRRMSYTTQSALSYSLTAIMTILVLVFVLYQVWERQFASYTRSNIEALARTAAVELVQEYELQGGWTDELLADLGSAVSVTSDVGVQILDAEGNIIYDDTWGDDTTDDYSDASPTPPGSKYRVSLAPTDAESTVTADLVTSDGEYVGMVRLWAFGSDALLTKADQDFRAQSYRAIFIASLFATALACVIGTIVAHSLSRPIKRITSTAASIRAGNLTARSGVKGEDEVGQLGEMFDDMASSLERDLKFEHQLTSDVAHELRTPLMALLATVEAMQDGVMPCDGENLAIVSGEVRRLSRLVEAMLQLSRIENGTAPFEPAPHDMAELARNLVVAQEQLFAENDLRLTFYNDEASVKKKGKSAKEKSSETTSKLQNDKGEGTIKNKYKNKGGNKAKNKGKSGKKNKRDPKRNRGSQERANTGATGGLQEESNQMAAAENEQREYAVESTGKNAIKQETASYNPPIMAEADYDMITRAMTNLLSNALRYTPEGGSVEVHVGSDRNDVLISVKDTGIGIDPEDLSHVFSRFWRSDASRERVSGGLGVGLALTKHILDRHNGYVSVESAVGVGSTFTLHIPKKHVRKQARRRASATMIGQLAEDSHKNVSKKSK